MATLSICFRSGAEMPGCGGMASRNQKKASDDGAPPCHWDTSDRHATSRPAGPAVHVAAEWKIGAHLVVRQLEEEVLAAARQRDRLRQPQPCPSHPARSNARACARMR